jgi:hypothetical protein
LTVSKAAPARWGTRREVVRTFAVEFQMRKGLGAGTIPKTVFVGLDDLDPDMSETEIEGCVIRDAEEQLYKSEDFALYGKTWTFQAIYND